MNMTPYRHYRIDKQALHEVEWDSTALDRIMSLAAYICMLIDGVVLIVPGVSYIPVVSVNTKYPLLPYPASQLFIYFPNTGIGSEIGMDRPPSISYPASIPRQAARIG